MLIQLHDYVIFFLPIRYADSTEKLCPTVCSYLLLPSKMAATHERLYSFYPLQHNASRDRSSSTILHTYF